MTRAVHLSPEQLHLLRAILARNDVEERHEPVLFGSRVGGQARRYSDLDVAFAGVPLSQRQLRRLREDLEESRLPITVDVLNLVDVSEELRRHALATAVPLGEAVPA